ncbi:hypothetical protein SEHO0A_01632 [Salmonella enterica subsp. houtenae str. ATCC BAA-1581]|nr:hypothetical protein SEHO0A_01632 [Salmonella enterica subsp. houtenae str. ATCC BAA-1581]
MTAGYCLTVYFDTLFYLIITYFNGRYHVFYWFSKKILSFQMK